MAVACPPRYEVRRAPTELEEAVITRAWLARLLQARYR